jgi:hypothetical protein
MVSQGRPLAHFAASFARKKSFDRQPRPTLLRNVGRSSLAWPSIWPASQDRIDSSLRACENKLASLN